MNFENLYPQLFTKDHQTFLVPHNLQGGREGIKEEISSSSNISGNSSETVLPHTNRPATQIEMFSCPNMEKVSPGIAVELIAEDHNCFSQQVLYSPAPQHLHTKDSHELCAKLAGLSQKFKRGKQLANSEFTLIIMSLASS